ncbi:MAG TPA: universal stress protein [Candidatus Binatia bacterium]|nr:universal stress protein [Candidatus Binatia bacterium]
MARTRVFRRIVHASDFSPASRPAFRKAVELAKGTGAQLLIVHVLPVVPILPDAYIAASTYDTLLRGQETAARRDLNRLVARAKAAGARASGVLLDFGVPAARIARLARARRADLIVMGTHGRTGLTRALLGSVAARVLTVATCPVLTVHA